MSENQAENTSSSNPRGENAISDYYDGVKNLELQRHAEGVKKARTALFVAAALIFIGELVSVAIQNIAFTPFIIGIAVIEAGIFVALAFWTRTKPFTAIVVGLIVFIGIWILAIVASGTQGAISGIIVRIIIISYLISALKPAREWENAKKNM